MGNERYSVIAVANWLGRFQVMDHHNGEIVHGSQYRDKANAERLANGLNEWDKKKPKELTKTRKGRK